MSSASILLFNGFGQAYRALPADRIADLIRNSDGTTRVRVVRSGDGYTPADFDIVENFLTAKAILDRALAGATNQEYHQAVLDPSTDCGG